MCVVLVKRIRWAWDALNLKMYNNGTAQTRPAIPADDKIDRKLQPVH